MRVKTAYQLSQRAKRIVSELTDMSVHVQAGYLRGNGYSRTDKWLRKAVEAVEQAQWSLEEEVERKRRGLPRGFCE